MIARKEPESLKEYLAYMSEEDRRAEKLAEAIDQFNAMVDPLDAYRDGNEMWLPLGAGFTGSSQTNGVGTLRAGFQTETELSQARDEMRYLASTNPYAINAHENRISYIVGDGHTYKAAAKKSASPQASEAETLELQAIIDDFVELNDWHNRQQETVLRLDRDGEVFLRKFVDGSGRLRVRFVEPYQVATPPGLVGNENVQFGIRFDEVDAETPVSYFVNGEEVPAEEIQHRKSNVDRTAPRGVPLMFGQRFHLKRANKNVLNISAKIDVISSISLIRKHTGGKFGAQSMAANQSVTQRTDPYSGQTTYGRRGFGPGTILDTSNTVEYDAPAVDGVDQLAAGVALNLRCIASRLVMPEFMVSSDASNANYSSTMVAEGPCVKSFERLQKRQSCWDLELLWAAVEARGIANAKQRFTISVGMPAIITRDDAKETERRKVLYDSSILSPQEWSTKEGLDYEQQQADIEKHGAAGRVYKPGDPVGAGVGGAAGAAGGMNGPDGGAMLGAAAGRARGAVEGATAEELAADIQRQYAEFIGRTVKEESKDV